ncbi:hypothetical protein CAPTEDRAFT_203677 [Capitella teleta]|uniref:Uncharacterized protein n=1 Tax=Capitella teleta TaxID=283909 RepID=R7U419_CAPTE|nr:hypothetical protein CAPTEDRAFT_203677 [Capitella teleta]|eukprot:ELT98416.1 hypothetical protein CAPTEDRAFT_203677 [Capitella teleta]
MYLDGCWSCRMSEEVDSLVCEQLSPVPAALLPLSQPHRLGVGSFPRMLFSVFSQQANGASVMAADRAGSIRRVELPSDVVSDLERGQLDEEELSDERIALEPPAPPSIRVTDGLQPGVPLASYRERDGQLSCSLPDFVSLRKEMLMRLILHKDVSLTDVHDYCQRYEELHLESESEAPSNLQGLFARFISVSAPPDEWGGRGVSS